MNASKDLDESEQQRESLLDLARANEKEHEARTEAEALLAGLYALTDYNNREKMFENLLNILRGQIGFDNAFILASTDGDLKNIASTSPRFLEASWSSHDVSQRMVLGRPLAFFDVDLVPEWQSQSFSCRQGVRSALHVLLRDKTEPAILICTHSQRGFFSEKHLRLSTRFAPLASQALINLDNRSALEKMNQQLHVEINERQKAQAQIVNISKMAALGEMAGGIAHEINTPLGAMILNAEMIEMENSELVAPNGEISKRAENIMEIGYRISKIISGLKGFSRDAKNDSNERFTARELIEKTVFLCGEKLRANNIQLKIDEEFLDAPIDGQLIQISQTLLNLLSNAYDAVQSLEEKWIQIKVMVSGKDLKLKVTDSGHGISPAVLEKIFQPFFTTKDVNHGTGLGLSISRSIVEKHGGNLYYDETSPNTCFVIQLPAIQIEGLAA